MEKDDILKALDKLGKGGKLKTKAITYEFDTVTKVKTKTKEVVTTKEFLPDKSALNKIMELKGLGKLDDSESNEEEEFEI